MWISPKTLFLPVLASFADYKLLDFDPASDSMTLNVRIDRMVYMYVTHDTQYICLLTLGACALGTVAKIVNPDHCRRLPCSVHWRVIMG